MCFVLSLNFSCRPFPGFLWYVENLINLRQWLVKKAEVPTSTQNIVAKQTGGEVSGTWRGGLLETRPMSEAGHKIIGNVLLLLFTFVFAPGRGETACKSMGPQPFEWKLCQGTGELACLVHHLKKVG